jgi:hypothetical protein
MPSAPRYMKQNENKMDRTKALEGFRFSVKTKRFCMKKLMIMPTKDAQISTQKRGKNCRKIKVKLKKSAAVPTNELVANFVIEIPSFFSRAGSIEFNRERNLKVKRDLTKVY